MAAALVVQVTVSLILLGYPAVVPFVKDDLHLTLAQAGVFASIPGLGMLLGVMAAGWTVDRTGERRVLTLGGLATGAAAALPVLAPSYPLLLAAIVVVGVGGATPTPAGARAVMVEFPRRQRGLAMGIRQTGVPLGGVLAALTLPPIAVHAGWRPALAVAGASALLGAALGALFYRLGGGSGGSSAPAAERPAGVLSLFNRNLLWIGGCGFIFVMGQYCLVTYVVVFLHQTWGLPLVLASLFLAATHLSGAAGRVSWGWFSDAVFGGSRRLTLVVVSLAGAAGVIAVAWIPAHEPFVFMAAAVVLAGGCVIGWNGVWVTMLAEVAPPGLQARSIAAGLTFNQPGILLGPWLFGLVVDATGSFQVAWTGLAALLVVSAGLITRAAEPRSDHPARTGPSSFKS